MTNPAIDLDILPYSAVRATGNKPQQTGTPEQNQFEQNKGNEQYQGLDILPYEEINKPESKSGFLARGAARTLARGAEALVGLPGDLMSFIDSMIGKGATALGVPEETIQKASQLAKTLGPVGPLPSSSDIRSQITQPLTGQYLEPQTEGEETYDEFVGDLATLMLPVKGKIPFMRSLGTAIGANLGKEGLKSIGATDSQAQWGKLALMTMLGSVGRGNAKKFANNLYREAIEMIPEEARIGSPQLTKQLDTFIANLQKGGMSPQKQPAYSLAKQLRQKIRAGGGDIQVNELPEFRKSINDYRFNRKAGLNEQGRFYLDRFDDVIDKQLLEYGKQNPSFLPKYKDANTAIAGFKQSNKLARAISKYVDVSNMSPETIILFGLHLQNPSLLKKIAGGVGLAKSAQLLKRVTTNPVLRKHYENVVKEGLKGNSAGLTRNLNKLDEALKKEDFSED